MGFGVSQWFKVVKRKRVFSLASLRESIKRWEGSFFRFISIWKSRIEMVKWRDGFTLFVLIDLVFSIHVKDTSFLKIIVWRASNQYPLPSQRFVLKLYHAWIDLFFLFGLLKRCIFHIILEQILGFLSNEPLVSLF